MYVAASTNLSWAPFTNPACAPGSVRPSSFTGPGFVTSQPATPKAPSSAAIVHSPRRPRIVIVPLLVGFMSASSERHAQRGAQRGRRWNPLVPVDPERLRLVGDTGVAEVLERVGAPGALARPGVAVAERHSQRRV